MKDVWWGHGDGSVGVFGGHTSFGDARRYWDFRSLGHGDIRFEDIIVALNDVGYRGPFRSSGRTSGWTASTARARRPPSCAASISRRARRPSTPPSTRRTSSPGRIRERLPTNPNPMRRKLRFGMIGGGRGAFIGAVHRIAAAMDGRAELVAGAFSSDPVRSKGLGRRLFPRSDPGLRVLPRNGQGRGGPAPGTAAWTSSSSSPRTTSTTGRPGSFSSPGSTSSATSRSPSTSPRRSS